jgi:tRNA(adenine34) deaminase
MRMTNTRDYYMRHTLVLAEEALNLGELPIAAIVVLDDRIVAQASTTERREGRFLGHAELLALEQLDRQHPSLPQRRAARLFTNLEPCLMCLGAAMSCFVGELVYALESPGDGGMALAQSWVRREEDIPGYRPPRIEGGALRQESLLLFRRYVSLHPPGPMRAWAQTLADLGDL